MRPRTTMTLYQTAARVWLTLAVLALLLTPARRAGLWLPLHLTLAGAIATAISGAMQYFMVALTATPPPPAWTVRLQFALVTAGAALIAIGFPEGLSGLVAAGGAAFVGAVALLGAMLWFAWSKALNRRHAMSMAIYGLAVTAAVAGATIGALLGSHAIGGTRYLDLRRAHMTLNVLGFASLTVVGTLVTLLPTALRVRMPVWRGRMAIGLFVAGLLLEVTGWSLGSRAAVAAGGLAYAAGALHVVWLVASILRVERNWGVPVAAFHMMAGVAWFTAGSLGLARALLDGAAGFDRFRPLFLTAFIGGWLVQVLLGAWSYLLPMARPGHPDERRRGLVVFEVGARTQVVVLNLGLLLVAGRGAGWLGATAGDLGTGLALAAGIFALTKSWLFPLLARVPIVTGRARSVWGG